MVGVWYAAVAAVFLLGLLFVYAYAAASGVPAATPAP